MTKKILPAVVAAVITAAIAVPAEGAFITSLRRGTTYTYTFTRGDNNTDATGVVFLKVNRANNVASADPLVLLGRAANPDTIQDTCGSNIDALVILAMPSIDGTSAPGTFTITITNTVTQAVVFPTKLYTGDQQLYFQCVP